MDVMILAAGRGQRMGRLTANLPKPLLPLAGKTLIEHQLQQLSDSGFHHVVINTHYLGEQIHRRLGCGAGYGLEIDYSDEIGPVLDTGGGIVKALPMLSDPFVVVNADVWTDFPYARLSIDEHCLAHLVLVTNPEHHPQGDFLLQEGLVVVSEPQQPVSALTFAGIGCYRKVLFEGQVVTPFPLATLLIQQACRSRISGEIYTGQWSDVGTPDRLCNLQQQLQALHYD